MDWSVDTLIGAIGTIVICRIMLAKGREELGDLIVIYKMLYYIGIAVLVLTVIAKLVGL